MGVFRVGEMDGQENEDSNVIRSRWEKERERETDRQREADRQTDRYTHTRMWTDLWDFIVLLLCEHLDEL